MTWRELIYMIIDITKQVSDDSQFNEEHVLTLCSTYRNYILNSQYLTNKKTISESNYQTVKIPLTVVQTNICPNQLVLRSKEKVSFTMSVGEKTIYPTDLTYIRSKINFVDNNRFPYVGNKYSKNVIYATIEPDNYLYLKSDNPNFQYLTSVTIKALFDDVSKMSALDADSCGCDIMDIRFPLEDAWINSLMNLVINDLVRGVNMLRDSSNNAFDESDQLAQAINRYTTNAFKNMVRGNQNNNNNESA